MGRGSGDNILYTPLDDKGIKDLHQQVFELAEEFQSRIKSLPQDKNCEAENAEAGWSDVLVKKLLAKGIDKSGSRTDKSNKLLRPLDIPNTLAALVTVRFKEDNTDVVKQFNNLSNFLIQRHLKPVESNNTLNSFGSIIAHTSYRDYNLNSSFMCVDRSTVLVTPVHVVQFNDIKKDFEQLTQTKDIS